MSGDEAGYFQMKEVSYRNQTQNIWNQSKEDA